MSQGTLELTLWPLALAAGAAMGAALRLRVTANTGQRRIEELEASVQELSSAVVARDSEAWHLAKHQVPTLINAVWSGHRMEAISLLHPELADTVFGKAHGQVLRTVHNATEQSAERAERATQATLKTVIRSIQPLVNDLQGTTERLVERHHDEKVLADAIAISHRGNQLARRLQTLGVLIGSWPGRQRVDAPLLDVVRGGVSRIRDYDRIEITGAPPFTVTSRAVEPVVLCLAELLDNAARHSEPSTKVHVWFVPAHNGVTVFIDDSGIGMKPEDRALASRLLSGQQRTWITQLPSTPRFGFAAAGQFAVRYGFRAGADQESATGGVRAWVFVPRELLVPISDPRTAGEQSRRPQADGASGGEPVTATTTATESPDQFDVWPDRLPQRQRETPGPRHAATSRQNPKPPGDRGRHVGAFLRGVRRATEQLQEPPTERTHAR
ncbi:ATP-binding protein [Streptomyces sp. NPDC058256]|uniref:ATP-binding protein n=1 Tax=Streptomyces sp. NPDC058256 TaxID=3346408 RepID=UPI0036E02FC2